MSKKRVSRRPSRTARPPAGRREEKPWPGLGWLAVILWTLPALAFSSSLRDSFRLPKLVVSELLALAVVLVLVFGLRKKARIDWASTTRHPAILAFAPLLLVATLGLATTRHPVVVGQGLISLWIGVVTCIAWSLGLTDLQRRRALAALAFPAGLLAVVAFGQYHDLFHLFEFREVVQERIGLTSLAGGAFDLGAYLVIPALLAQLALVANPGVGESSAGTDAGEQEPPATGGRWRRLGWALLLVLLVYVMALTRTLSVLVALALASLVLWAGLVPRRRLVQVVAAVVLLAVVAGLAVSPLRDRLGGKVDELRSGNLNRLLSGRLDGWRTALWMAEQHPLLGVGHGAYRSEFGRAKLALREEGVGFYRRQHQPYFVNAHNDALELVAETGILGGLVMLWGLAVLTWSARRRWRAVSDLPPSDSRRRNFAFHCAALTALAVMAMVNFPLRLALVAYPYLMVLAEMSSPPETTAGSEDA